MAYPSCYPLNIKKYMASLLSLIAVYILLIKYNQEESVENKIRKIKSKPNVFFLHDNDYKQKQAIEKREKNGRTKNNNTGIGLTKKFQIIGKIDVANSSKKKGGKCVTMLPILDIPRPNCNLVHEYNIVEDLSFKGNSTSKIMGVGGKRIAWKVGQEHPIVLKTLR